MSALLLKGFPNIAAVHLSMEMLKDRMMKLHIMHPTSQ